MYKGCLNALDLHLPKVSTAMSYRDNNVVLPTRDFHHIRSLLDVQQLMPSPLAPIVEEPEADRYTRNREILAATTS
jgi:hypothetical protein